MPQDPKDLEKLEARNFVVAAYKGEGKDKTVQHHVVIEARTEQEALERAKPVLQQRFTYKEWLVLTIEAKVATDVPPRR